MNRASFQLSFNRFNFHSVVLTLIQSFKLSFNRLNFLSLSLFISFESCEIQPLRRWQLLEIVAYLTNTKLEGLEDGSITRRRK